MPSPFPGMDPYLERPGEWAEFHTELIVAMKHALVPELRGNYRARTETMLFIHEPPAERRRLGTADAAVVLSRRPAPAAGRPATASAVAAPSVAMNLGDAVDIEKHRYLTVRTAGDERLVTVIELLSPSNKGNAEDRHQYLAKREELLRDGVHFLQIDLLRDGPRLLPEPAPPHDYNAMLVHADRRPEVDVWFWGVRDCLPTLPVPLAEGDADVPLDLQAAAETVYEVGGYGPFLYDRPPEPPLSEADATWAAGRLATIRP